MSSFDNVERVVAGERDKAAVLRGTGGHALESLIEGLGGWASRWSQAPLALAVHGSCAEETSE